MLISSARLAGHFPCFFSVFVYGFQMPGLSENAFNPSFSAWMSAIAVELELVIGYKVCLGLLFRRDFEKK